MCFDFYRKIINSTHYQSDKNSKKWTNAWRNLFAQPLFVVFLRFEMSKKLQLNFMEVERKLSFPGCTVHWKK